MLSDGTTGLASTRQPGTKKYGFGLNAEQAFTRIGRSVNGWISVQGRLWKRTGDNIGVAAVRNDLAGDDRSFLGAGGMGFIAGDGRLNDSPESITEAYYAWHALRDWTFTLDYQRVVNPAYNRDRARFPWGHYQYIGNDSEMRELLRQPVALPLIAGVLFVCWAPLIASLLRVRRRRRRFH
jgi:hypothetical protein